MSVRSTGGDAPDDEEHDGDAQPVGRALEERAERHRERQEFRGQGPFPSKPLHQRDRQQDARELGQGRPQQVSIVHSIERRTLGGAESGTLE